MTNREGLSPGTARQVQFRGVSCLEEQKFLHEGVSFCVRTAFVGSFPQERFLLNCANFFTECGDGTQLTASSCFCKWCRRLHNKPYIAISWGTKPSSKGLCERMRQIKGIRQLNMVSGDSSREHYSAALRECCMSKASVTPAGFHDHYF
ncbi:hypothetical protein Ancab_030269 [Ancistrocladus abbreviatus]